MKISVITPSFNHGEFIEDTIRSVANQDHDDIEHIVVDGGSTDSTLATLKKYPRVRWVSEQDSGQGNAINKGFAMATGDVLAWLNADDYYEENVFGRIIAYFKDHPDCMFLYGDLTFVDKLGRPLNKYTGDKITYDSLIANPDIVRQPSSFWRREVMERLGGIDESFHLVMDLDFFLRVGKRYPLHYLEGNLSYYRHYGETKSTALARRQVGEIYRVYRSHGIILTGPIVRSLLAKYIRTFRLTKVFVSIVRRLKGSRRAEHR
ncbi:MAG: hypothetical protein A2X68_03530 [Ignavibacteria bacterium GWC2_56_12]|nr:MAG: hypothetical protein A2X68_03530 [Ignavibacteria bacterium GWC2_56_12]